MAVATFCRWPYYLLDSYARTEMVTPGELDFVAGLRLRKVGLKLDLGKEEGTWPQVILKVRQLVLHCVPTEVSPAES